MLYAEKDTYLSELLPEVGVKDSPVYSQLEDMKEQYSVQGEVADDDKLSMVCDWIFAYFLFQMCKQVNKAFGSVLVNYVLLLREVVNDSNTINEAKEEYTSKYHA